MKFSTILATILLTTALTACGGGGGGGHGNIPNTTLPDFPSLPDNPDTPDTPDNPDTPDTPDTPDNPDTPDTPDTPDNPDIPDNPNSYLKDMVFYKPGDGDKESISFVVDANGNLKSLEFREPVREEPISFEYIGESTYVNNSGLVNYGFVYEFPGGGSLGSESITFPATATPEEVRKAFKKEAMTEWGGEYGEEALADMLAWIDSVDFSEIKDSEDDCDGYSGCIYKEHIADKVTLEVVGYGKDMGLKYTDFGVINYSGGTEYDFEPDLYYGGNEILASKAQDLPQVDTEMKFEGKALAQVVAETDDEDFVNTYNGLVDVTFKDGKETVVADFEDWHKVTVETDGTKASGYAFTFENTPTDEIFSVITSEYDRESVDIIYYGENSQNPEEVSGVISHEGWNANAIVESDIVFGASRK